MTRNADLHPDDTANRATLAQHLRHLRATAGHTHRSAGNIVGLPDHSVRNVERRNGTCTIGVLQLAARAVDRRLTFTLHHLPDTSRDPAVALWRHLADNAATLDDRDHYDRTRILAELTAARHALGVTAVDLSRSLGLHQSAVAQWERVIKNPLAGTYQRYARGLGGRLELALEPIHQPTGVPA